MGVVLKMREWYLVDCEEALKEKLFVNWMLILVISNCVLSNNGLIHFWFV